MSDIIVKAQRSLEITQAQSPASSQRVELALEALSGMMLSQLNDRASKKVETQLAAVNQTLSSHNIKEAADFEKLSGSDALGTLNRIGEVARLCIDFEADRVMQELETADRKLPVAAIKEVRQHPDIFAPLLIHSLRQSALRVRHGDEPDGASFFAIFLLTELEVTEAFPVLLEVLFLPGEGPFEVFGDGVHELVAPILALFSRGDTDEIGNIIQDSNVNIYVRWSALRTYMYLVRDESISREFAIDALERHFRCYVENGNHDMLAPIACELGNLAAESSLGSIRAAYQRRLVDKSIVDLAFIESQIASGEETVIQQLAHCGPTGMPDTIAELSHWAAFREEPKKSKPTPSYVPRPHLSSFKTSHRSQIATVARSDNKVGRNHPCPCGSGKKFKKCCR